MVSKKQIRKYGTFKHIKGKFSESYITQAGNKRVANYEGHEVSFKFDQIKYNYLSFVELTEKEINQYYNDFVNLVFNELKK